MKEEEKITTTKAIFISGEQGRGEEKVGRRGGEQLIGGGRRRGGTKQRDHN